MSRFGNKKPAGKPAQEKKKSSTIKLFDIRIVETKNGPVAKAQFPKNVEIYVDGEPVSLGEYNSVFLKTKDEVVAGLEKAVDQYGLSEEYAQKQVDYLEEKNISSVAELYIKG